MLKHIFADLDGTITESRQVISFAMKRKLSSLKIPIIVISGAEVKRIEQQLDGFLCIKMGQNGNDCPYWYNKLTKREVKIILNHINKISQYTGVPINEETLHNRGCQISFSLIGHTAPIEVKKDYDPTKEIRNFILKKTPLKSHNLEVRVAGTTCLDYNRKGNLKGDNIKRYMKLHNLNKKDCIYYGDNFEKGGNDESVLGVMKCVKVKSPKDLLAKLTKI